MKLLTYPGSLKPILSLGCAAALLNTTPAHAAATVTGLQADGSYTLGAGPLVNLPSSIATPPGTTVADVLQFTGDSFQSIGIHAYGESTAASFGSRASGQGQQYSVDSNIKVSGTFTGDTFSSTITPGQIYVSTPSGYLFSAGEFVSAYLKFSLVVDAGSPVTSEASLTLNAGGLAATFLEPPGGFAIGYALTTTPTYSFFSVPGSAQSISGFGVGTHSFEYTIYAQAAGLGHLVECGGGGSEGQKGIGGADGDGEHNSQCGPGSGAQSGDPLGGQDLPEPASPLLVGLGMAALAGVRRTRAGTVPCQAPGFPGEQGGAP